MIISDNGSSKEQSTLMKSCVDSNVKYIRQNESGSLKNSLHQAINLTDFNPTILCIWETDAVPDLITFKAMLTLFTQERKNKCVSVSPMYKWKGGYCYPTHKHWHTDPIYKVHHKFGEIAKTHAVPFLFSVWEPTIFRKYINCNEFRPLVHLDSDFGTYLSKLGFNHLRLKRYSVGHYGGGKNSRK